MQRQTSKSLGPLILLIVGVCRSLFCGGWVYITSTDHHDVHDVCMVSYIICNVPWMLGSISYTPSTRFVTKRQRSVNHTSCHPSHSRQTGNTSPQRLSAQLEIYRRPLTSGLRFFASIVPMIYFFIQHKVHKIPGGKYIHRTRGASQSYTYHPAYTRHSFFEWGLIFLDISFDSILATDLRESGLRVRCVSFPIYSF